MLRTRTRTRTRSQMFTERHTTARTSLPISHARIGAALALASSTVAAYLHTHGHGLARRHSWATTL
jgi:hypothetical protein